MTRSLSFASLVVLALGGCGGPDPGELAGDYRRSHKVFVFHGSEPVEVEAEDSLALAAAGEAALGFALRVTSVGGEACALAGRAEPVRGGFEYRLDECVLRIRREGTDLLVEDVDDRCRAEFCGERSEIGRLRFQASG